MRRVRQRHHERHHEQRRQQVAQEAARWMAEGGVHDYAEAKRKAARRLGIVDEAALPRNEEIQAALRDYQRLFQGEAQPAALRQRREAAVRAMGFFAGFAPRLTGPVLDGTADAHSPVILHLHVEDADEVARFLLESDIPADVRTVSVRLDKKRSVEVPAWHFVADDVAFELKVLPLTALHQAPLSALDEKPAPRATVAQVRGVLEEG